MRDEVFKNMGFGVGIGGGELDCTVCLLSGFYYNRNK